MSVGPKLARSWFLLLFAALVCMSLLVGQSWAQQTRTKQESARQSKTYERPTDPSLYVGSETCKSCHEDMPAKGFFKSYEDSPHYVTTLDTKRGPEWHGCESCHGPGKEHAEGGGDKSKIFTFKNASAADTSARCLGCHGYGPEHANFGRSAHLQNNVGCTDCHDTHHPKQSEHLMKVRQPQLCYGCHLEVNQQFARTFHHRVNEGLVQCSDCHNPHGTFDPTWRMSQRPRMVQQALGTEIPCVKCHVEKRGPFVFEHDPVRAQGCETCHSPHGSTNAKLLRRPVVFTLCLECHNGASNFGPRNTGVNIQTGQHNMLDPKYQKCTTCHVMIHGSNADQYFKR